MSRDGEDFRRELRRRAETLAAAATGTEELEAGFDLVEARILIQDLRIHQIELELQNEELRATQHSLEEARDGFSRLYHEAPIGYLTLDGGGTILQANRRFQELLPEGARPLIGSSLASWLRSPDREGLLGRYGAFYRDPRGKSLEARVAGLVEERWLRFTGRREGGRAEPGEEGGSLLLIAQDITETRAAEERVRLLLAEKELLLKETHHRVKNNMNSICALLRLQAARSEDSRTAEPLHRAADRVQGMSLLYERLFRSEDHRHLSARDYLSRLGETLGGALLGEGGVSLSLELADLPLDSRLLFPLGLIVNELVTNAAKYAFRGLPEGGILVRLRAAGECRALLLVADDGLGMDPARGAQGGGFGLGLVEAMALQIEGELRRLEGGFAEAFPGKTLRPGRPGTAWLLDFPLTSP